MPKDLRGFLRLLADERPDNLVMVSTETDPAHGISGFVEALERQKKFPAVLFNNVKGSKIPCLLNLGASFERMALALDRQPDLVTMEEELARREQKPLDPIEIAKQDAPVKEVIYTGDQVDLTMLPILRHNEHDAGLYIDAGPALMVQRGTGVYNMGLYRHQLQGKNQLGVMINPNNHGHYIRSEYEEAGEDCPVAIVIGHHPWFTAASVSRPEVPGRELAMAGAFLGEPVEMVPAETIPMLVPARAEIIIEGYIPAGKRHYEGPFGEWPHYYYKQGPQPYMVVTAITTRRNPIYQSIFNAHPEHNIFGCAPRLGSLLRRVKGVVPGVKAVNLPYSGGCRAFVYISMKKRSEGEPKQAAMAAFVTDNNIRQAIVVDEDINVFDEENVLWAMAMRFQADRDLEMLRNTLGGHLNPGAYGFNRLEKGPMETKLIFDCTKPLPPYEFPLEAHAPEAAIAAANLNDMQPFDLSILGGAGHQPGALTGAQVRRK